MEGMRILIVDDHEVVRRGVRNLLESHSSWRICGEAADGRDAVRKAKELKPTVVVLDISMPELNGLEAAGLIRREVPQTQILILSQHESPEAVRAALNAGASGYVAKANMANELIDAIEALSQHQRALGAEFTPSSPAAAQSDSLGMTSAGGLPADREPESSQIADPAQLLDLANDAIFVRTLDHKLTYWNKGAERLYGWRREEVLGLPVSEILHTEFPQPFGEIQAQLLAEGDWQGELMHYKRDGTRIAVSSRWSVWRDQQGRPLGYLEINTDISELKAAEKSLRQLTGRLLQLQDDERRRIARELHDSAGQLLVALDLNLSSLGQLCQNLTPSADSTLEESLGLVRELSKELRTISHLLHPPLLDESGLPSALRWYVDGFAERSKIPVKLELSSDLGRLSREVETTVFRIVQESLTNVHRHSGSRTAAIKILRIADQLVVEVRDEGNGMPVQVYGSLSGPATPGVGIQGMRERVRQIGGRLDIRSGSAGTTLCATLPVRQAGQQSVTASGGVAS
jgi:PAS domain S-box-containing protein